MLSAIAKQLSSGPGSSTPAKLKAQMVPLLKKYVDSSTKLQRDAPPALRNAVKAYLDQGGKALFALEKAGWDLKKVTYPVLDPPNFMTTIAPLVAYAETTCGVTLTPLAGLSTETSPTSKPRNTPVAGASSATRDPCRLLSAADVTAVLGKTVVGIAVTAKASTIGTTAACMWGDLGIAILGDKVPRAGWEKAERDQLGLVEVRSVGELAFYDKEHDVLDVFDRGIWLQVRGVKRDGPKSLIESYSAVALKALKRI